jgi:hypothetical protein
LLEREVAGFLGDGGPAREAELSGPAALAVDAADNLYFIDGSRIRKISPDARIQTIAGTGKGGFSGDGGPAKDAMIGLFSWCNAFCGGLATDNAGNLYVADSDNLRVRRISPDGIITTVAGNGSVGHSGDGGPATGAQFVTVMCVATDGAGNLLICDGGGYVRRVSADGTITTVVGTGSHTGPSGDGGPAVNGRLSAPAALAVDRAGNLFIADPGWYFYSSDGGVNLCCDNRIRRVSPDGTITTVAGTGAPGFSRDGTPASAAPLNEPVSVAVDAAGNIYFAEILSRAIRVLQPLCAPFIRDAARGAPIHGSCVR